MFVEQVEWLAEKMRDSNFTVSVMHGDMPQKERDAVMAGFQSGATRLMITTDVWARGIDVEQVCLVVNYDLPNSRELYVHQAGQVGHFGRKGVVVNFVKDKEIQILRDRAVLWHPHMRMSGGPCQYNMTR